MPQGARLGDVTHLQDLREPTPRLDLAPRHVLQQARHRSRRERLSGAAVVCLATALVHVAFAVAFAFLLTFRAAEKPDEIEPPVVDLVSETPDPPKPPPAKAEAAKAPEPDPVRQALATPVAPDPKPPAPPAVQPITPPQPTVPPAPPPAEDPAPPRLVAAPPEPSRAASQDQDNKTANLEPDRHDVDQATHEARPADVPRTLTTNDVTASFAVPLPPPPKPEPVAKPAPPIPAKVPSEADKLAAALPMDTSDLPMSFRAVLSGNGAAVSAAYKGLVYGRFGRRTEIGERARRQHLKGQVVVAFSIDETGRIIQLAVLQSSGDPAVDALGLEMIRAAAPYPPPPPEAQRSFTPALSFGE